MNGQQFSSFVLPSSFELPPVRMSEDEFFNASSAASASCRRLGTAVYRFSNDKPCALGEIVVNKDGKTRLHYQEKDYDNAKQWINLVFNNSGKSCVVKIEKSQDSTPRPTTLSPDQKYKFSRFA
jgi:hypothetical protein